MYHKWQEQINNRDVGLRNVLSALTVKFTLRMGTINHHHNSKELKFTTDDEIVKQVIYTVM